MFTAQGTISYNTYTHSTCVYTYSPRGAHMVMYPRPHITVCNEKDEHEVEPTTYAGFRLRWGVGKSN
jgi:hypothetical protein